MSLVVNHNMMSANTARILNQHYSRLNTSTQRLSSGLRINSAADDAAGLAIRELQRADISALRQGARNANDAISMIQTADGALQVIDEKLIRMKELAEQAATGTYDSTQRLMIESEYQAMAAEITRIAKATDFNGIHLLNGNLASSIHDGSGMTATGKMKIHFGTGNDCSEDYYYIQIKEATAEAFSLGSNATWDDAVGRFAKELKSNLQGALKGKLGDGTNGTITQENYNNILASVDDLANQLAQSGNVGAQAVLNGRIDNTDLGNSYKLPDDFANLSADDKQKLAYAFGRDVVNKLASGVDIMNWNVYGDENSTAEDVLNSLGLALAAASLDLTDPEVQAEIDARIATAAGAFADFETAYNALYGAGSAAGGSATAAGTLTDQGGGAQGDYNTAKAALETAQTMFEGLVATEANIQGYVDALAKINAVTNNNANPENLTAADIDAFVASIDAYIAADNTGATAVIPAALRSAVEDYKAGGMGTGDTFRDAISTQANTATTAAGNALTTAQTAVTDYRDNDLQDAQTALTTAKTALDGAKATLAGAAAVMEAVPGVGNAENYYTAEPADRKTMITNAYALERGVIADSQWLVDAVTSAGQQAASTFVDTYAYDGMNIATQENAQIALDAVNKAIVQKDKIRANLGALQNRLENTISNLNIQAENLQAAESRISDADVSTEMTEFVRNQILTQSAVAMLAQANSLPKMAMQLIGG